MTIRQAYIYVLHFDVSLGGHASHYAGCTHNLKERLTRHANGHGSAMTRHLYRQGLNWSLGSVQVCSHAAMRRIERHLKDTHNAARFCGICAHGDPQRLPEATPYPIGMLGFPTTSQQLRPGNEASYPFGSHSIRVRLTAEREPKGTEDFIKLVMDQDKDALGFVPAGGPEGIRRQIERGLVAIVYNNDEPVGYSLFSFSHGTTQLCNIHQCAVRDDARLCGHGNAMVQYLRHLFPTASFGCKVRDDLAANHFWEAVGFTKQRESYHATSGSIINVYKAPPIITV